jgi:class 3 adenylate cyclase/predicted ATPase
VSLRDALVHLDLCQGLLRFRVSSWSSTTGSVVPRSLRGDGSLAPPHRVAPAWAEPQDAAVGAAQARRRTVTVVFSDLVGSTALGELLDPETVQDALDRYFSAAKDAIERHGGLVEKFIGDAILAVFGLPNLHEDDALRAIRAALDMREALALVNETLERDFGVQLHTRTGVNTGEVVTGDASGGERLVTGDAVNVAARLEQSAAPDSIVIGETTFALVGSAVESERLEALRLKGKTDDVVAYRVHSLAGDGTTGLVPAAPFVDRKRELAQLGRMISERAAGPLPPIVVLGEAGIGKSRLVAEALRSGAATAFQGRCLPYGDGITYWPIIQVLRRVGEIRGEDSEEIVVRKLRQAVVVPLDEPVVISPLVSLLVGSSTYPAEEMARAFRGYMEALATSRDVALLIEDVHWAEPTFLDLIEHTAQSKRVRIVCTARPEFVEGADGGRSRTIIELAPLGSDDASELVSSLAGHEVATTIRERLIESSGGNPFFLEQIVANLRDDGALDVDSAAVPDAITIPPSVAAVLDARLDQLSPGVRDAAERASVVGHIFYPEAVEALGASPVGVDPELAELHSKGFIQPSPTDLPGLPAFAFSHILIRDAVYRGALKRRRAEWHERLGRWLEERALGGGREEFIGFHLEQANRLRVELGFRDELTFELAARASELLGIAGHRAADRNDASAAAGLLARAIELLPSEPVGARIALMVDLAFAELDAGSVVKALETARAASEAADPESDRALRLRATAASILIEVHASTTPDYAELTERVLIIERELQRLGEPRDLIEAMITLGIVYHAWGQMSSSADWLEAAAELADEADALADRDRALDWLVIALYVGPTPVSEALRRCEAIIASTRPRSLVEASARSARGVLFAMALDLGRARAESDLARSILEELGMPLELASLSQASATIELLAGDPALVEGDLHRDRELLTRMDAHGYRISTDLVLARVLGALGKYEEAAELVAQIKKELPPADVASAVRVASIEVPVLVRRGLLRDAEAIAREASAAAASTDIAEVVPLALTVLADVFAETGRSSEARLLLTDARKLHLAKENVALASHVEARLSRLPS